MAGLAVEFSTVEASGNLCWPIQDGVSCPVGCHWPLAKERGMNPNSSHAGVHHHPAELCKKYSWDLEIS